MSTPRMRAKFVVSAVEPWPPMSGSMPGETITMRAVGADKEYGPNGENEDNDFARFTPMAELTMSVTNPDLLGKIQSGQRYYIDFTEVPTPAAEPVLPVVE